MTKEAGHSDDRSVLVVNGTGKTGRRVVEGLRARGVPVRVGSRAGHPPVRLGGLGYLARRAAGDGRRVRLLLP